MDYTNQHNSGYAYIKADNISICLSDEQIMQLSDLISKNITPHISALQTQNDSLYAKELWTVKEASEATNIGINKISELCRDARRDFVFFVGKKKLIRRKEFMEFLSKQTEI
ncbi:excisionase [Pseudobutyrivibrio sp.]|jgi:excisionase family DNA binding protein|uniref:excisionase n=1 Tax=Pseudobutyrivibrio sp. TaxID=2014367 RepID=UPI002ED160CD